MLNGKLMESSIHDMGTNVNTWREREHLEMMRKMMNEQGLEY
jgi:hypothetical protein